MRQTIISPCKQYRYVLWRCWDEKLPTLNFVMQNPSTADVSQDDATIRRCLGFAKDNKFGSIRVLNVFAYRATYEQALYKAPDPVGPSTESYLYRQARYPEIVVLAWGNPLARLEQHYNRVLEIFAGKTLYCLGTTKSGNPKHPLYLPRATRIVEFSPVTAPGVAVEPRSLPPEPLVGDFDLIDYNLRTEAILARCRKPKPLS